MYAFLVVENFLSWLVHFEIFYYITVPSGPPTSVAVTSTTPTSITLSISQPNPDERNGIITGYTVTISEGTSNTTRFLSFRVGELVTVPSLRPYTTYQYTVTASTIRGRGPSTPSADVTTNETG